METKRPFDAKKMWRYAFTRVKLKIRTAGIIRSKRHVFLIKPDSRFKLFWDVFTTMLLLYSLVETPFSFAFINSQDDVDFSWTARTIANLCIDISFMLDVLLNFITVPPPPLASSPLRRMKMMGLS
jgi:hypothetical protein